MKSIKYNVLRKGLMTLALGLITSTTFAQNAGDMITGVVSDSEGPLMMVNVVELDNTGRIVAHAITDINGEFSLKLGNPKDKLQVTYVGYETVNIPIDKTRFDIVMKEQGEIEEVVINADRVSESTGLAIPDREISSAAQRISMDDYQNLGITSVDEIMQGTIPGLDIVFGSGDLGKGSTMRMRGASSFNGNTQPLIVVDGNPMTQNVDIDYSTANEERFADLLNINPEDISTITVLKDAAATAIWGSQGANGVIEIKTRRGSRGKTRTSYTFRLQGSWQPNGYKLMNGDQYTMFLKESYFNPALNDAASDIVEISYDPSFSEYRMYNNNTDWQSLVKQFGLNQDHNISISGGGERANFRVSAGYAHQNGSIIAQVYDRFTTRVALDYFISDRIKVTTNFNMTYQKNYQNSDGLLSIAQQKMPNLAAYYEEWDPVLQKEVATNEYYHMLSSRSQELSTTVNPLASAYLAQNISTSINISPEFNLTYNLLGTDYDKTRLTYDGRINFGVNNNYSDSYRPAILSPDGWSSTDANKASSSMSKSTSITTTHSLTLTPHFKNKDHSVMAMVRAQIGSNNSKNQGQGIHGLPSGSLTSTGLPGTIDNFTSGASRSRNMNFATQVHYSYKSKYSATLTTRTDGSTAFGDKKRWATFPALSFRWNISDEQFFKDNVSWITMMSIRPGIGIVGNAPGGQAYLSKYSSGTSYLGVNTIYPNNIKLSSYQWEENFQWNLGFDFGFFEDKITADVNFYASTRYKMIQNNWDIPTSSGFSSLQFKNSGSLRNTGWELNLNANRFVRIGKFSANANVAFSDNKNELLSMESTVLAKMNDDFNYNNGQWMNYVALHNSFGSIYGFKYKGVYQYSDYSAEEIPGVSGPNAPVVKDADGNVILNQKGKTKPMMFAYGTTNEYEFVGGDAIYEDINHDGNINELDIVYLGSCLAKISGGFGLRFQYGRFSWNNQFNFRLGNKIINDARMTLENMYNNNNASAAVNWRWRVEGDLTEIPRALHNYGYNYLASDRFVEPGDMLTLNYTQISYNFDSKKLKLYGLSSMNLSLSMNQVFTLTRYSGASPERDPDTMGLTKDSSQTPRSKSVTANLSIQF